MGLSVLGSILRRFLGKRYHVVWKSYSWLTDKTMGKYLHSNIELRTLRVHTCMDSLTERWTFTLSKFDEPFGVRFHFERFFENQRRLVWRSYSSFDTTRLYTQWIQMCQRKDGFSHYWKFDEPFGVRFHFEEIFGNRCRLMWGSHFWLRTTWLYTSL